MRMLTIRRAALLGLLVFGVVLVGCTAKGDAASKRQAEAQKELAERAGVTMESLAAGAPAGGSAAPAAAGAASDPAKLGLAVATQYGCAACHSVDGNVGVGPTWKGISGHEVELADGSKVNANDAYIKESILTPNAKVVKGFQPNVMPATFGTQLKPEQIDQLVAYIKGLK